MESIFWVLATFTAAFGQALRSVIQKRYRQELGLYGSAYVRFLYGFPASLLLLIFIFQDYDVRTLHLPVEFYVWLVPAAIVQILFTIILGKAFEQRNFATSIALSKTDAIQAALFELILLSLVPDIKVVIAISISFLGVYIISLSRNKESAERIGDKRQIPLPLVCLRSCARWVFGFLPYRDGLFTLLRCTSSGRAHIFSWL